MAAAVAMTGGLTKEKEMHKIPLDTHCVLMIAVHTNFSLIIWHLMIVFRIPTQKYLYSPRLIIHVAQSGDNKSIWGMVYPCAKASLLLNDQEMFEAFLQRFLIRATYENVNFHSQKSSTLIQSLDHRTEDIYKDSVIKCLRKKSFLWML